MDGGGAGGGVLPGGGRPPRISERLIRLTRRPAAPGSMGRRRSPGCRASDATSAQAGRAVRAPDAMASQSLRMAECCEWSGMRRSLAPSQQPGTGTHMLPKQDQPPAPGSSAAAPAAAAGRADDPAPPAPSRLGLWPPSPPAAGPEARPQGLPPPGADPETVFAFGVVIA